MKKLLTEWRQFLKENELSDVEASVERDADLGKHADMKMEIENALDDAGQDWVLDMDDWPAAPGRSPEEFQKAMTQIEAALQNYLGVSIKGLLAGELLPKKNESVEKEISKTLSDEGGASGLDPLHKAAKKVEKKISKKEVQDIIKKMDNVTKHRDGDYIKEEYYHISDATYDDGTLAEDVEFWDDTIVEAEYRGRKVKLNKPMRGDVKKFKVYVKDPKTGNVKKVNFGDKKMRIKKSNPKRRKSFRARHNCDNPGPKTKARYWSCRKW